ncbi:alpha/beta fold hydrolase [Streptomyces sp. NPDC058066]|uniref:alpha/beta fold hydrolase n=1 Tax=Streptomyces sp. NPDC058066 TaxID=3346323 RepID=UPI0036E22CE0
MSQLLSIAVPENARSVQFSTPRGVFAALDMAPSESTMRGTALLVPGFMGSKEDYLSILPPLSRRGVRVVAIDGRGQNETGKASANPSYARDDMAQDLVAIVQELGDEPVHLLGHSYGGIAARAAVIATEGDPSLWASLTLMNFGPASVSAWQQERLQLLLSVVECMPLAAMWPYVRNSEVTVPEDVAQFLEQRWLRNAPEHLAAAAAQMLSETDRTPELSRIPIRKAVISGTPDETWDPATVERMARELDAEFFRLEGGGHSPNVHRPTETASALAGFWSASREVALA